MKQEITMGSLFSGSGGFELAGSIFGIRPIWASEIEPFPILVTTKNFPEMKHLGDINKLNGADLEPVTIIAGGSPCQDMSIAGKREGLDGSRSNLFREQIRIIKEMRESDRAAGRTGTQMEAMGESKKEKTDNQIRKWLKDPESDSAKYKMWGNGIALPCAMFVMEGIAMILSEEDADEQQ